MSADAMDPASQPPLHDDAEIAALASAVGGRLLAAGLSLVAAESCTGGWIGKACTDLAGSSAWFRGGAVAYSNELKVRLLGVSPATLEAHGAVSRETALEMARGALDRLGGEVGVAVTGIAGPSGGQPGKPVGTVWFAWAARRGPALSVRAELERFPGSRDEVRRMAVCRALRGLLEP